MAHSNVRSMLSDAVNDAHRGTGKYASYMDHTGDGESGDCIYNCDGDTKSCPYSISSVGGKATANLETDKAHKVQPTVQYQDVADDSDHYTSMDEAQKTAKIYLGLPLYERFISKDERSKASDDSFAGKSKSFPILKPSDVSAAVHAMGRAGSDNYGPAALKANIIRIAKAKGWASELPKAWQGTDATEAAAVNPSGIRLVESMPWSENLLLSESVANGVEREIRIIVPCTGSSAVYTEAALQKSASNFRKGTQMFINHATPAEESARPEGDYRLLAGQLTSGGEWKPNHKDGPAIYANAKFVSSLAPEILEKASMSGVSIKANGKQAMEAGRPLFKNNKPVLEEITSVESIDLVTKAGAGGLILTEAARHAAANNTGDDMTPEQQNQLREAAKLVLHEGARRVATATLADVSLNEAGKQEAIRRCLEKIPTKEGLLDEATFVTAVKEEAKTVGAFMASFGGNPVRGMGVGYGPAPTQLTEAQIEEARKGRERLREAQTDVFTDIMGDKRAGGFAAKGRAA